MKPALYGRVSSEEQRERETILTQKESGDRYCKQVGVELAGWYPDDGVSGTVPFEQRPGAMKLLQDARRGLFDTVLVFRLDRIGRSAVDVLNIVERLDKEGIQIKSLTEPFDTTTPSGKLMMTILAAFAAFERDSIIQRSIEGTNRLARESVWLGGIVPYGYRAVKQGKDSFLEVWDEPIPGQVWSETDVVRFIYKSIGDDGKSCFWVSDVLNRMAIPPSYVRDARMVQRGKRKLSTSGIWRPARIRNMVVSTTYKGVHVYGRRSSKRRELIERSVPSVVTGQQWQNAQDGLRANLRFSPRNAKNDYLLRGLIRCDLCGLTYVGTGYNQVSGKRKSYYVCNGKHGARGIYGLNFERCPSKSVNATLEDTVWKDIEGFLRNPGEVLHELNTQLKDNHGDQEQIRKEIGVIEGLLGAKDKERDAVVSLFRRGRINDASLDRQLDEIDTEERKLKTDLVDLTRRIEDDQTQSQERDVKELLVELNKRLDSPLSFDLKRQIVETLVDGLRVETVGSGAQTSKKAVVKVRYRFAPNTLATNYTPTDSSRRPA